MHIFIILLKCYNLQNLKHLVRDIILMRRGQIHTSLEIYENVKFSSHPFFLPSSALTPALAWLSLALILISPTHPPNTQLRPAGKNTGYYS